MQRTHSVWAFRRDVDLDAAVEVALDERRPPDFGVSILRSYGDELRVAVDWGGVRDPTDLFYLAKHGFFRVEGLGLAAPVKHQPGRQTLKFVAWPQRSEARRMAGDPRRCGRGSLQLVT